MTRSFTNVMGIRNNAPSDIGPARLGVRWLDSGPPPSAGIIVMPIEGDSQEYKVGWGQTFPVGTETWRFSDVWRGLPASYRQWLAENNGAQPAVDHHVPGLHFALFAERPLLGVHPQYPPFDLVHAEQRLRQRWLSDEFYQFLGRLQPMVAPTGDAWPVTSAPDTPPTAEWNLPR